MRGKLFSSSLTALVVSCLLIAYSGRPTDITAVVGFAGLIFALALAIFGFYYRDNRDQPLEIGPEEKSALRQEFLKNGEVSAIKRLRENHPKVSIVDARDALRTLIK